LDNLGDAAYEADIEGNITYVNETGSRISGVPLMDLVGNSFLPLFTPESQKIALDVFQRTLKGESPEYELTFTNGKICHFKNEPLKGKEGKIIGVHGIARDITERKQTEEALREKEETIRALVETSRDWIWSIDAKGVHTYCNPAVENILGYSAGELVGKLSLELIHEDDRKMIEAKLPNWISEKRGWNNLLIRWHHKDGSFRYLESNAVPILDAQNELIGFRGVDRDITERKRQEEELKKHRERLEELVKERTAELEKSEEKYRQVIENSHDIIYAISPEGILTFISPQAFKLGYSEKEIIGHHIQEFIHPDDIEHVMSDLRLTVTTGEIPVTEFRLRKKDGTYIYAEETGEAIYEGNKIQQIVGSIRDITERKQAEEAAANEHEKLLAVFAALPDFVYVKAPDHSIRFTNQAFRDLFGEPAGRTCYELFRGRQEPCQYCPKYEVFETRQSKHWEWTSKEGRTYMVHDVPYTDLDGSPLVLEIGIDITERKQAEETLRQSEARFRAVLESSRDIIYRYNLINDTVEYISPSVRQVLGMSPKEYMAVSLEEFFSRLHPEDGQKVQEKFESILKRDAQDDNIPLLEYRWMHKDGHYHWWSENRVLVRDEEGRPTAMVGTIRDVTEIKRAEEMMRIKDNAIASSINAIAMADLETKLTYVNDSFLKMWGYADSREVLGRSALEFWEKTEEVESIVEILRTEGTCRENLVGKRKDGSLFDVQLSANLVTDEGGRPICMMGSFIDITEHKRAEETLRESEQRFRAAANCTSDLIYEDNSETGQVAWYGDIDGLLGYDRGEFSTTFQAWKNSLHPEDRDRVIKEIEKCTHMGEVYCVEYRIKHKDGTYCYWVDRGTVFQEEGKPRKTVGACEDITERKRAEEEVRKFRTISDRANYGTAISDLEGNLIYINDAFARMHGYTPEDLIGKNLSVFHTDEQMKWVNVLNEQLTREGSYNAQEVYHKRKDGSVFPTLMNATVIKDDAEKPMFLSGTMVDITEPKRAEEQLKSSEHKFRMVFDHARDGIMLAEAKTKKLFMANRMMYQMLGYEPQELRHLYAMDIHPLKDIHRIMELFEKQSRKEIALVQDIPVKRKNGEIFYADVNATPVTLEGNKYLMGVFRDVTERRRAQAELQQYREKMVRAERLAGLGAVGAALAHRLNQPLTVIRLMLEDSQAQWEKTSCPQGIRENLKDGLSATTHAETIVKNFLGFAPAPDQTVIEDIDLKEIADRVALVLSENARQAHLRLVIEDMSNLPKFTGDPGEIEQIFFMLMENAIQAADGKKERQLNIRAARQDDTIVLTFTDDCGGINPQDQDKIFEPFFSTKPRGQGTGLGLNIVQQILTARGGTIRVESQIGQGATFFVNMPWLR
ncbi:PAS domain S-box protein, partial [Planctomycetota bacterium]